MPGPRQLGVPVSGVFGAVPPADRVGTWSPARVEERLRKAAALRESLEAYDSDFAAAGKSIGIIGVIGVGTAVEDGDAVVAEAAEALSWLNWLDPVDAGIVVARLDGAPWKAVCWRFGISRPTADRRWRYSMALIAWRLNGPARSERVPSLRSLLGLRRARGHPSRALNQRTQAVSQVEFSGGP